GPAAIGAVIDGAVAVAGVIARIPARHLKQAAGAGAPDHAKTAGGIDEVGEQADNVDAHQKSASQSTSMRPAARSISRTWLPWTKRIRRSASLLRTTSTSFAPVANTRSTTPSSMPSRLTTARPSRSAQ